MRIFLALLLISSSLRADSNYGYDFYEKDNTLILIDKADNRTYKLDKITSYDNFRIRMGVKKPSNALPDETPSQASDGPRNSTQGDVDTMLRRANTLYFEGKPEQALEILQNAEKAAPTSYQIKTMMGSSYFKMGNNEKAREYWLQSMKLNPAQPEVVKNLNSLKQE